MSDECRFRLGDAVGEWEAEVLLEELFDVRAADVVNLAQLDDAEDLRHHRQHSHQETQQRTQQETYMNRPEARTMTRRHILIQTRNRIRPRQLPKLLIHIMRPAPRIIANPNPKVLHAQGAALSDLIHTHDLAVGLFHHFELAEEVPEARLGDDLVGCEDAHAVELGRGLGGCGEVTSDDLVFFECHCRFVCLLLGKGREIHPLVFEQIHRFEPFKRQT